MKVVIWIICRTIQEGGGGLFDSSPSLQPGSRKSSDVSSTPQQAVKPQSSSGATTKQPNKAASTDVIKTSVAPARGLFDDDDDDDDDGDIFSSRSVTAPKKSMLHSSIFLSNLLCRNNLVKLRT